MSERWGPGSEAGLKKATLHGSHLNFIPASLPPSLLPPALPVCTDINTIDRNYGEAYLTRSFFTELSKRMGDRVLLVVAELEPEAGEVEGQLMAAALNLIGSHALFGRNWGCLLGDRIPNLHFEVKRCC